MNGALWHSGACHITSTGLPMACEILELRNSLFTSHKMFILQASMILIYVQDMLLSEVTLEDLQSH